jgi:hypothetical protein
MATNKKTDMASDICDAIREGTKDWTRTRKSEMRSPASRSFRMSRMIIAQDLRLQIGRDGHGVLLGEVWRRIEPVRRRRNSRRTNGGQRHPHQWQDQFPEQ